jgi:ADP-heptose:LPS heptosyltransferase
MIPLDPKRILIIKPSAIGDVVHTLPILNLVRKRWPGAHVAWLVTPACAGLLEGHPQLDEIIVFDRKRLGGAWKSVGRFLELRRFARGLREKRFDLVLDLQGLFRSGWLAKKTRAPVRVGFANARELAPMFYTHRVAIETMEQHAIERYLKLARFVGCDGEVEYVFATDDADRAHVRSNAPGEPFAVLLPGTNWVTKRLPVETFAALVAPLRERFGLRAVVAGSAGDGEF